MLHVLNGDATRVTLERSGVAGDMTVWADVLHDGPVPDLPPGAFRAVRAAHLSRVVDQPEVVIARNLERWDMALERYRDHDEVVFWFEHDLFDQLILARHLHWLSTIDRASVRFSLICVGEYPGIAPFNGLGQLSPAQLATLFPRRVPISDLEISTGRYAWNLFRAADPVPLSEWHASADTSALPFLKGALRRHLEDFPSLGDGLSRSERQMLRTLGDRPRTPGDMFAATQALEERVFMGDATFWSIVRGLARGSHPLMTIDPHERDMPLHGGLVELTSAGRDVLAGAADQMALNGIDRWMGGAHLTTGHHWRWDQAAHRVRRFVGPPLASMLRPASTEVNQHMAPEDDDRDLARGTDDADTGGGDEDAGMEEEVGGGWVVVGGSGETGAPASSPTTTSSAGGAGSRKKMSADSSGRPPDLKVGPTASRKLKVGPTASRKLKVGPTSSRKPAARKAVRPASKPAPKRSKPVPKTRKPAPKRSSAKAATRTPSRTPKRAAAKKAAKTPKRSAAKKSAAPKRKGARKASRKR